MIAELTQPIEFVWGAAVGIGVIVILCVIVLLGLLNGLLKDIDLYVGAVQDEVTGLARNTATSPLLDGAVKEIQELADEVGIHVSMVKEAAR